MLYSKQYYSASSFWKLSRFSWPCVKDCMQYCRWGLTGRTLWHKRCNSQCACPWQAHKEYSGPLGVSPPLWKTVSQARRHALHELHCPAGPLPYRMVQRQDLGLYFLEGVHPEDNSQTAQGVPCSRRCPSIQTLICSSNTLYGEGACLPLAHHLGIARPRSRCLQIMRKLGATVD
jgi:hypothetical protein